MQLYKYYYQMPKDLFYKSYKLTDKDEEDIKDSVKRLGLDYNTAKGLRLNKIYEDSRYKDPEQIKIINRHLEEIEKNHKKLSEKMFNEKIIK